MKSWLKFFGLSFFSDKISKQALKRGYSGFVLGMIFALVFLFCGVLAADILPFKTHYNGSEDFKTFVRGAFESVSLEVKSGRISSPSVTDTFLNAGDAEKYCLNGYQLVIDTRPADALDDFQAYYLSNDGENQEITLEEYATLSDVAKRNFDFRIRYTPDELVLTDELTAEHEIYLAEKNDAGYTELRNKQGELSRGEYQRQVYALFVKSYYPDLSAYESTGSVPLLRNYYYHNYADGDFDKYFMIFDDSCAGAFVTDGGLKVSFYGFYNGFPDGKISATAEAADAFVTKSFAATSQLSVYVYMMNILRLLPFIVLMPLVLALICFCVFRLMKAEWCKGFGGCVKIVGSYLLFGSFFAAVITFILGYFVPRGKLLLAAVITFFLILLIRTAVFIIYERLTLKKEDDKEEISDDYLRG